MNLEVTQDGLTYVIKFTNPSSMETIEALLREDQDGWDVNGIYIDGKGIDKGSAGAFTFGRRKTWQKALHDTLVRLENMLKERDHE